LSKELSDKKFRAIFESTLDGIILSDFATGKAIECNDRIVEMLMTSKDRIINGQGVLGFSPELQPENILSKQKMNSIKEEMLNWRDDAEKDTKTKIFQWRYKRTDGTVFDSEVVLSEIEADGQRLWLNIIRDISDRINTQKELRQRAAKFKRIFNQTFHLTWLLKEDGTILQVNDTALKLLDIAADEMENRYIYNTGFWIDQQFQKSQLCEALEKAKEGEQVRFRSDFFHKNNRCTIDFSIESLINKDSDLEMLVLEGREITDLIIEKEKSDHNRRLYLSVIQNTEGMAVFIYDDSMVYRLAEGNYQEMFNYSEEEIIGTSVKDLITDIKGMGSINYENYLRAIGGELVVFDESFDRRTYHGKLVPMRESKEGKVTKVMAIILDVTNIKSTEAELIEAGEILKNRETELEMYAASNSELENFAYMVSHDLKEPLRNILGFTQLLKKNYSENLDPIGKDYLDFIVNGGTRMNTLITSLLDYSKVNTGQYNFTPVKIESVLAIASGNLMNQILESKAFIRTQVSTPTNIQADLMRMSQLFQNLLANAMRFAKTGEDNQPIIDISGFETDEFWQFSVADNGVGIQPSNLTEVFSLFRKFSHPKQKQKGAGIGLAICKKIVEQHGGKIWVESVYGEGATFYFTISKKL